MAGSYSVFFACRFALVEKGDSNIFSFVGFRSQLLREVGFGEEGAEGRSLGPNPISWYQEKDFSKYLPMRLLLGSISLVISVVSMLVSYFAGHSFLLNNKLKNAAFAVYAVIFLPMTLFAARRIPFYIGLVLLTFRKVPIRKPPERKQE
ncbi:UNVERIFIED_CONTAM: hypothetical protein Scaly_0455200 [Sesamum calycinum]|uniref:PGG domain-containing protein n=1 Tax=Sesamum calycinum TaxID=2727403 RepID=A0AAW2SEM1_9LAMI